MATEEDMLFRNFLERDRADFLAIGYERLCQPKESVIRDGAVSSSLFIALEGEGSIWKKNIRVATIQEGDVFGESVLFLFQNPHRISTVQAETPMRVLEFRRQEIFNYFKWKEERLFKLFVLNVITILLGKLNRADERIVYLEKRLHEQTLSAIGEGGA